MKIISKYMLNVIFNLFYPYMLESNYKFSINHKTKKIKIIKAVINCFSYAGFFHANIGKHTISTKHAHKYFHSELVNQAWSNSAIGDTRHSS